MTGLLAAAVMSMAFGKPVPLPPAVPAAQSAMVQTLVAKEDLPCSLNVADWEINKVLRVLSEQTGVNLVLLGNPGTKLTLRLSGVRLGDMIRHICALSSLDYLKIGTAYVIATPVQLQTGYPIEWTTAHPVPVGEPLVTEIYTTNYVSSSQIAAALVKLYSDKNLSVVAGPVASTPSLVDKDASAITGQATVALTSIAPTENGRMLLFRGPRAVVDDAIRSAKSMDVKRPQVGIEVTIHDISNEALKELGLSWSFGNLTVTESQGKNLNFGAFTRAPSSFSGVIKALETADKAKLLAAPNVSVLDGERAFILIGDRINFPVLVGYSAANTPIFDKKEERVGIYLQVAAQVSTDNSITLTVYPQVSTVTGFLEVNGASYPQISTREVQTTLRVKSGETIVLGGLLRDEELHQLQRVPILGSIPFLGELFTRRKKTHNSSQVIISIQPKILEE